MPCPSFCKLSSRSTTGAHPRAALGVLDVKHENGQARDVSRVLSRVLTLPIALSIALGGCARQGAPEQVADAFVEAYFQRADQEKAKEYTALGATEMLDQELREVAPLRKDGYTPAEAHGGPIEVRRGEAQPRDQRIRFPYEIKVRNGDIVSVRDADVELATIRGAWKVVRVGVKPR
jgi:hypothetical protein